MNFDDLKKPEFQEKLKAAKSTEDLRALVKEEGYELSDEELKGLAGGFVCHGYYRPVTCPKAVDTSGRPCKTYVFV